MTLTVPVLWISHLNSCSSSKAKGTANVRILKFKKGTFDLIQCVNLVTTEEKRLLLNDPDVLVNRLNRVENIVATLNATVKRLSTENQQQTLTIQQQEKTIQQHQISTLQQQAWITQQNTSNQQQQASIEQQQALIQQQQTTIQQQQTINQQQEQTIKQLQSSFNSIPSKTFFIQKRFYKRCQQKSKNSTQCLFPTAVLLLVT
ncbi:Hypothetical predicted protein, partial [Mytilus galloprovincialis]